MRITRLAIFLAFITALITTSFNPSSAYIIYGEGCTYIDGDGCRNEGNTATTDCNCSVECNNGSVVVTGKCTKAKERCDIVNDKCTCKCEFDAAIVCGGIRGGYNVGIHCRECQQRCHCRESTNCANCCSEECEGCQPDITNRACIFHCNPRRP